MPFIASCLVARGASESDACKDYVLCLGALACLVAPFRCNRALQYVGMRRSRCSPLVAFRLLGLVACAVCVEALTAMRAQRSDGHSASFLQRRAQLQDDGAVKVSVAGVG